MQHLVDPDLLAKLRASSDPLCSRAAEALERLKLRYQYLEHDYADTLASREVENREASDQRV